MSNYIKATDFQAKDALITGDPLKTIKGQEINDEFNAIQTAIATKADISSPNLLGNPTAPTQAAGNNSTRLATTGFVASALATSVYPVGSIYLNATVATNPATLLGFGTWVAFGAGKMMVGLDSSDTLFDTVEKTGGSKNAVVVSHTHTASYTPPSSYAAAFGSFIYRVMSGANMNRPTTTAGGEGFLEGQTATGGAVGGSGVTVTATGSSGTNANLPPYITVYMWKRTA